MVGGYKLETICLKKSMQHARNESIGYLGYDLIKYEGYAYGIIRRHVCDLRSRNMAQERISASFDQIKDTEEGVRQIPAPYRVGLCKFLDIKPASLQLIVDGIVSELITYASEQVDDVSKVVRGINEVRQEFNQHIGFVDDLVLRAAKVIEHDKRVRGVQ